VTLSVYDGGGAVGAGESRDSGRVAGVAEGVPVLDLAVVLWILLVT